MMTLVSRCLDIRTLLSSALLAAVTASNSAAQPADDSARCNASAGATSFVDVQGSPFQALTTPDGCTVFLSQNSDVQGTRSGVAVYSRANGKLSFERILRDNDKPYGMVMTHDGKLLIVANNSNVVVLNAESMATGKGNPLAGYITEPGTANPLSITVNVTPDDRYLFVAEESADRIAVVDLSAARQTNFMGSHIVGSIPAGLAPIALIFSPDARYLYVTVQEAPDSEHKPEACKSEADDPATAKIEDPEGEILVVDVARAETDPENSVVGKISAGCNPVRLALSADGTRAYVTARGDHTLLVFDTAKFLGDAEHALIAAVPVGTAPVGVALVDDGRKIVVANSNRFGTDAAGRETLSVIDTSKTENSPNAMLGRVTSGLFPRELSVTADGKTLLVTNSDSDQLELVDLTQLP